MAEPICPNCVVLERRVAELEALVAKLLGQVEALQRAGKRQAAPFAKAPPKQHPKTPGRKSGRQHGKHGHRPPPPTAQIDEKLDAPLPEACPECGGDVQETHVDHQYQTEIPRQPILRQFTIHCGTCSCCGGPVQGRHPLQTSDALGAAASQLGPDAQAAIVYLNKHAGLSHGKIKDAFWTLFGIRVSRGASAQVVLRAGQRLQPAYQEIQKRLRKARVITPDETGWRVGGHTVWLHAWVGDDGVTCYHIDPQRSADALERLLGIDWSGSFVHDGWASYDRFADACHQQCQAHVLRRAHELEQTAVGRAKVFPRQIINLFRKSLALRDRWAKRRPRTVLRYRAYERFRQRLLAITERQRTHAANNRLAAHLYHYAEQWFLFLLDPTIPATNYRGEQAIRPAVVNRKVWGGNRTHAGARAQSITMSILRTCQQQTLDAFAYISHALRGTIPSPFSPLRIVASR
jgi:transposase